jgi:VWFA-related protein
VKRTRAAAVLVAAAAWSALGQAAPARTVALQRVDVTNLPVVQAYLTVTDQAGASVLGLADDGLTVALDGIPQKITSLKSALSGGEYLAVALLFDRSGSMKRALDGTKGAAIGFIRRLSVDDRMAVISFDDQVRVDATFTADRSALEGAVRGIASGTDTALYDAIQTALDLFADVATKRQAILVLSDGKDTKSTRKAEDVLTEATKRGVPVYTLGLGQAIDTVTLSRIAGDTGGSALNAANPDELRALYQRLADLLQNQYALTFESSFGQDEAWHTLEVGLTGESGPAVSAKRAFIASRGPGISRETLASFEKRSVEQDLMSQVLLWAALGLAAGALLLVCVRLGRPDVSLLSPLALGILLLAGLLGGIVGVGMQALGR